MRLGRRTALLGAAALAGTPARAAVIEFTVVGNDGWLFAIFDSVRQSDPATMGRVAGTINEAVAILKRRGTETAIALTPSKARVYREALPADFRFTPEGEKRYALALQLLRASGAVVPDLAGPLLEAKAASPDAPVFLHADSHWTAAGAEAAATAVAREVQARLHLPPPPGPGTALGGLVTMRQGGNDLADPLPGTMGAKYKPETYRMHEVQASGGSGLLDEDRADTLVVGNSFAQPKYGFAAMLSNRLGRPVSLTWKVHQGSPYRTLLGALTTEPFVKARPKLLVWLMSEADMLTPADQAGAWGQNAMSPPAFLAALRSATGG